MRLEWELIKGRENSLKLKCVKPAQFSIQLKTMMATAKRRTRVPAVAARISTSLKSMLKMRRRLRLFLNLPMSVKKKQRLNAWLLLRSKKTMKTK